MKSWLAKVGYYPAWILSSSSCKILQFWQLKFTSELSTATIWDMNSGDRSPSLPKTYQHKRDMEQTILCHMYHCTQSVPLQPASLLCETPVASPDAKSAQTHNGVCTTTAIGLPIQSTSLTVWHGRADNIFVCSRTVFRYRQKILDQQQ